MKKNLLTLLLFHVALLEPSTAFVTTTGGSSICAKSSSSHFSSSTIDNTKDAVENSISTTVKTTNDKTKSAATATTVLQKVERSESLPFLPRPTNLKGYVGDVGFDPWGFSNRYPMEYLREAELKHGRVGTLAWTGWVAVDLGLRIYPAPLDEWQASSSADALRHLAPSVAIASHPDGYWTSPFFQGIVIISFIEMYSTKSVNEMISGDDNDDDGDDVQKRKAGDIGFDVIQMLKGKTDAEIERMKLRELKNLRLGMLAFFGVLFQSMVLGHESFPYFPN